MKKWREMDASELHARRLNAKEVLTPQRSGNFIIPSRRWNGKTLWRRWASENIHLNPGSFGTRRRARNSPRNIKWLLHSPTLLQDDSTRDDEEAKKWLLDDHRRLHLSSSRCTQSQTKHAERRIISYSVEAHRRFQKRHIHHLTYCWKNILKITGTWMEKKNCQIHGQDSQDSWSCMRGHLTDIHGLGVDLRANKQPQDQTMYGQIWGNICLMQRKAKWSKDGLSRIRSSIMPEDHVVSSSLNQMMKNFNTPWTTLVESWQFRCQRQCLAKHQ